MNCAINTCFDQLVRDLATNSVSLLDHNLIASRSRLDCTFIRKLVFFAVTPTCNLGLCVYPFVQKQHPFCFR